MLENPYNLHPATGRNFIGRADILAAWNQRLTPNSEPWQSARSWMVVGTGGMGKTSLLHELIRIANEVFKAHTISIDLGHLREIGDAADLFATLSIEMPEAKRPGTKLRKWFGLQPHASLSDLVGQIAGELLNQVTGFSLGLVGGNAGSGIKIANFRQKPSELEGTAHRLAQFLVNLSLLSEEQDTPVIVFLDQIGKCHDDPTWAYIAGMFLGLCKKMRSASASQVFFVISLRPEHEGLLRHQIDRHIFNKDIFIPIDLYPLSFDEAVDAIVVRGGAYIGRNLARGIVTEIAKQGPLDPYTIQLSSMGVWNYIVGDQHWNSPTDLEADTEKLHTIIRQGHAEIIHPFMQDSVLWNILICLSQSQGGLTVSQLHARLSGEHNLSTSEVKTAISHLLNTPRTGYRLLTEVRGNISPNRYILAHDLLRDYIVSIIPTEQHLINQANTMLEYALWRYKETKVLLSNWELELLWKVHSYITLSSEHLDMIINSELPLQSHRLRQWTHQYLNEIIVLHADQKITGNNTLNIRLAIYSYYIRFFSQYSRIDITQTSQSKDNKKNSLLIASALKPLKETILPILLELAHNAAISTVRYQAGLVLEKLGYKEAALEVFTAWAHSQSPGEAMDGVLALGKFGTEALPVLTELAQSAKFISVRYQAAIVLEQSGYQELALPVLTELALSPGDDPIRWDAFRKLVELGKGELVLPVLTKLVHITTDSDNRARAASLLGELGQKEIALPVLIELAKRSESREVETTVAAVETLGKFGPAALPVLTELVRHTEFGRVRIAAIKALGKIGPAALPVLTELAQHAEQTHTRLDATKLLTELGSKEIVLPILTKLAYEAEDEDTRLQAARTLLELCETERAFPVLSELAQNPKSHFTPFRAIEDLGKIGPAALPVLTKLAQRSENHILRWRAIKLLLQLGETEIAFPVIFELGQDSGGYLMPFDICEELERIGPAALPVLTELAQHAYPSTYRLGAARLLVEWGQKDIALPVLTEVAQDPELASARLDAARLWLEWGQKEIALPVLTELAQSERDTFVSFEAAITLRRLGDTQTICPILILTDVARNSDLENRIIAALGELGIFGVQDLLTIAVADPLSYVGGTATLEMIRIGLSEYIS
jgi:HEAT repeat protein